MRVNFNNFKRRSNSNSRSSRAGRTGKVNFKSSGLICIPGLIAAIIILILAFPVLLIPVNPHSIPFWIVIIFALAAYCCFDIMITVVAFDGRPSTDSIKKIWFSLPLLIILMIVAAISGSEFLHAKAYSSILKVEEAEFTQDISQTMGTDSIALMDTASAKKLGDREIGSLSSVVSQYEVSENYSQIDYNGTPKKVSALNYAGFFKWLNNRKSGVPGYVIVDPVTMSASYQHTDDGMKYVPSAFFLENAYRHIWLHYPTAMFGNLHFEIDESGKPYYVASVYKKTISLFGGETISGCIILDPASGETSRYALADVPVWVDDVYDGDMICTQYNWYGQLRNGFINSVVGKKGCNKITSYYNENDEESSDFGYVAKDGDIWIYTGVTSVNSDSSNIGFLLANERTGESHFFSISGADEWSAMAAAEGEVQEKGYRASFPSLINVDDHPTYIMVLKDNSGLVKLYAAVNVQQYNLVTTASTQKECISKYKKLLGIADSAADAGSVSQEMLDGSSGADAHAPEEALIPDNEATITIADIKYIDIDGNTYIYLISTDKELFKARAASHEDMLLLGSGDSVHISCAGNVIVDIEAAGQENLPDIEDQAGQEETDN